MLVLENLACCIKWCKISQGVLYIHSPSDGHSGCFQLPLTTNNTVMNFLVHDSHGAMWKFLWALYPRVELLDHKAYRFYSSLNSARMALLATHEGCPLLTFPSAFTLSDLVIFACSLGGKVASHCCFNLHFSVNAEIQNLPYTCQSFELPLQWIVCLDLLSFICWGSCLFLVDLQE